MVNGRGRHDVVGNVGEQEMNGYFVSRDYLFNAARTNIILFVVFEHSTPRLHHVAMRWPSVRIILNSPALGLRPTK